MSMNQEQWVRLVVSGKIARKSTPASMISHECSLYGTEPRKRRNASEVEQQLKKQMEKNHKTTGLPDYLQMK